LPEIGPQSVERQEFWNRRKLRPEGEGPNFNNMPILKFGIQFDGEMAVLSVPTAEYLNNVVTQHNSGGFSFVRTPEKDLSRGGDFLARIAAKQFGLSSDHKVAYWGIPDNFLAFKSPNKKDPTYAEIDNTSLYEHDLVDHAGLAALPASEADKIANFARTVLESGIHGTYQANLVAYLDRVLDLISDYAILPSENITEEAAQLKDFVWLAIKSYIYMTNVWPAVQIIDSRNHSTSAAYQLIRITAQDYRTSVDREILRYLKEQLKTIEENGDALALDREIFDDNIRRMQLLPAPRVEMAY
jgi:hypothetical protein